MKRSKRHTGVSEREGRRGLASAHVMCFADDLKGKNDCAFDF